VKDALRLKVDPGTERSVRRSVRQISERWPKKVRRSLRQFAEEIIAAAKKLAPVDTGAMRNSGHVEMDKRPDKFRAELGFGGPAQSYTEDQHENFTYQHEVGGPKFLEKPFLEKYPDLPRYIAAKAPLDNKS
jgi:hypothetical protein